MKKKQDTLWTVVTLHFAEFQYFFPLVLETYRDFDHAQARVDELKQKIEAKKDREGISVFSRSIHPSSEGLKEAWAIVSMRLNTTFRTVQYDLALYKTQRMAELAKIRLEKDMSVKASLFRTEIRSTLWEYPERSC
jgi:hypothetical protein